MKNYPADSHQIYKIKGINLHTFFYKYNPKNKYVFVLHGLRNDTKKMLPVIKILEDLFNVIAIDFPGYGYTTEYGEFDNYVNFCSEILYELIELLELKPSETGLIGGSFGANVIIQYLFDHPDKKFYKIGMLAPIYSKDTLSMKPSFKNAAVKLSKLMGKGGLACWIVQKVINNDLLFDSIIWLISEKPVTREFIDHEKRLWRICSIKLWGLSVYDTLMIDNSKVTKTITNQDVTFIYPQNDQYIDINSALKGYKKIFPNAKFKQYNSQTHMPKGDFGKNKEFMDTIKKLILESIT